MGNLNITLEGHMNKVCEKMISDGFVKTKTEAIRLALFEFGQKHFFSDDDVYATAAKKILDDVDSGKIKTKKFNMKVLEK